MCLLALMILFSSPGAPALAQKKPASPYRAFMENVAKGGDSLDYGAVRTAFAKSAQYIPDDPDAGKERSAAFKALHDKRYREALAAAEMVLGRNFLDFDSHFICFKALQALGEKKAALEHDQAAKGIMRSILGSGDGQGPKTAFKVIGVHEEYEAIHVLGLKDQGQRLVNADGHAYDVISVQDPEKGKVGLLYFNIDPVFAWEQKQFGGQ